MEVSIGSILYGGLGAGGLELGDSLLELSESGANPKINM